MFDNRQDLALTDNGTTFPIGKYKGQPVEVVLSDAGYREWLLAQPWFRERYGATYNIILNYGAPSEDSHEHNVLQLSFIKESRRLALARTVLPSWMDDDRSRLAKRSPGGPVLQLTGELVEAQVGSPEFEVAGWDLVFSITACARRFKAAAPLPECCCEMDHSECSGYADCRGVRSWAQCRGGQPWSEPKLDREAHDARSCWWGNESMSAYCSAAGRLENIEDATGYERFSHDGRPQCRMAVECKPTLGEDFPTVLRQVKRYEKHDVRCVVVGTTTFQSVSWDDVVAMFKASGIHLVRDHGVGGAA